MTGVAINDRLTEILREVFENDILIATPQLTAREVNGWDSLGHVRLMIEVETVFRVRFSAAEISSLKNVGELTELIARKQR